MLVIVGFAHEPDEAVGSILEVMKKLHPNETIVLMDPKTGRFLTKDDKTLLKFEDPLERITFLGHGGKSIFGDMGVDKFSDNVINELNRVKTLNPSVLKSLKDIDLIGCKTAAVNDNKSCYAECFAMRLSKEFGDKIQVKAPSSKLSKEYFPLTVMHASPTLDSVILDGYRSMVDLDVGDDIADKMREIAIKLRKLPKTEDPIVKAQLLEQRKQLTLEYNDLNAEYKIYTHQIVEMNNPRLLLDKDERCHFRKKSKFDLNENIMRLKEQYLKLDDYSEYYQVYLLNAQIERNKLEREYHSLSSESNKKQEAGTKLLKADIDIDRHLLLYHQNNKEKLILSQSILETKKSLNQQELNNKQSEKSELIKGILKSPEKYTNDIKNQTTRSEIEKEIQSFNDGLKKARDITKTIKNEISDLKQRKEAVIEDSKLIPAKIESLEKAKKDLQGWKEVEGLDPDLAAYVEKELIENAKMISSWKQQLTTNNITLDKIENEIEAKTSRLGKLRTKVDDQLEVLTKYLDDSKQISSLNKLNKPISRAKNRIERCDKKLLVIQDQIKQTDIQMQEIKTKFAQEQTQQLETMSQELKVEPQLLSSGIRMFSNREKKSTTTTPAQTQNPTSRTPNQ